MNKTIGIIIAIVIIVGGIYIFTRTSNAPSTNYNTPQGNQTTTNTNAQGRVVFSVTDAAVDMSTISEVNMKVSSVAVHSAASGWITVSTTPRTYSLLTLNAKKESELLADVKTKVGVYDQVRLTVDSVSVKTAAGVTKVAKLPSGDLKIKTMLAVAAGKTSSVNFDFLAKNSLHTTGLGDYIFAPVVKTQTQSSASLNIDANNAVDITNGRVDDTNTVGMDIDGSVKVNFEIDNKEKLNIDSSGVIKIENTIN